MSKKTLVMLLCICAITFGIIYFLLNEKNKEHVISTSENEILYEEAIKYIKDEEHSESNPDHQKDHYNFFVSYDGLGLTETDDYKYAYMWILGEGYYLEDNEIKSSSGYSMFYKFTFENDKVIQYEIPQDGSGYDSSIKEICANSNMYNKVIKYQSTLSNEDAVNNYYKNYIESN